MKHVLFGIVADSVSVECLLSGVCSVQDPGVHTMLQRCMHLVADSVSVECLLSGVCTVRDHGVHSVLQ